MEIVKKKIRRVTERDLDQMRKLKLRTKEAKLKNKHSLTLFILLYNNAFVFIEYSFYYLQHYYRVRIETEYLLGGGGVRGRG